MDQSTRPPYLGTAAAQDKSDGYRRGRYTDTDKKITCSKVPRYLSNEIEAQPQGNKTNTCTPRPRPLPSLYKKAATCVTCDPPNFCSLDIVRESANSPEQGQEQTTTHIIRSRKCRRTKDQGSGLSIHVQKNETTHVHELYDVIILL